MITSADIEMEMLRRMSEAGANTGKGIAYAGDVPEYFELLDKYLNNKHFALLELDIKKGNRRLALRRTQALIEAAERIGMIRVFYPLCELADALPTTETAMYLLKINQKIHTTCNSLLDILNEPERVIANRKRNIFGIEGFCFVEE